MHVGIWLTPMNYLQTLRQTIKRLAQCCELRLLRRRRSFAQANGASDDGKQPASGLETIRENIGHLERRLAGNQVGILLEGVVVLLEERLILLFRSAGLLVLALGHSRYAQQSTFTSEIAMTVRSLPRCLTATWSPSQESALRLVGTRRTKK